MTKNNLMRRVLLFEIFVCVVVGIIIAANVFFARARTLAATDQTLASRAQTLADSVDRVLQQRMIETLTLAALPSLRAFAASNDADRVVRAATARNELASIVAADPNVRAASIMDVFGTVVLTTDATMNVNFGERMFVREALAGHLHASAPANDFGELLQYYSAPLINNFGEVAGALVLRVTVQELWGTLGAQGDALLVDENGVRIADRTKTPQLFFALAPLPADITARPLAEHRYGADTTQIHATALPELAAAIMRGGMNLVVYRDASGQTMRAATRRMVTNPWTVIVSEPEGVALSPARDALIDQLIVALVSALATALLILGAQRIVAPRERSQ